MTREEAIDLLDNLIGMVEDNQNSNYDEAFKMGIKALSREANDYEYEIAVLQNRLDIAEYDKERYKEEITTLEAKNKGEWIPVSERLPKPYELVIRTVKSIGWNGTSHIYVDLGTICPIDTDAIAWQPLPEPYKADMRGGEE